MEEYYEEIKHNEKGRYMYATYGKTFVNEFRKIQNTVSTCALRIKFRMFSFGTEMDQYKNRRTTVS